MIIPLRTDRTQACCLKVATIYIQRSDYGLLLLKNARTFCTWPCLVGALWPRHVGLLQCFDGLYHHVGLVLLPLLYSALSLSHVLSHVLIRFSQSYNGRGFLVARVVCTYAEPSSRYLGRPCAAPAFMIQHVLTYVSAVVVLRHTACSTSLKYARLVLVDCSSCLGLLCSYCRQLG